MSQFIDQEINGYRVQKAIGEGKFSTVYKAVNQEGNVIALKKIKIFDMMDPKHREKCLKEVKLMQPLDHPNIIKYLDSFLYNNELIIATEWAEKGDLKKLIKNAKADDTPFEEVQMWNYILQIASALSHMHEKRIMHRDLKPANIFIGGDGTLKVGDLGLGRIFSSETIEAYSKVGTPLYMSPELLHGEGYDMKSDIWSLGCIAYEMAEFKSPFKQSEKMSLVDLFNNITKGEFKPVSNRYSQQLRTIIEGMIVVDPLKRLDSNTILQKAKEMFSSHSDTKRTPQIINVLVMEDIYEKLSLVQYHQNFCVPLKKKPISKYFFSLDENVNSSYRFYYFVDLCYWLMNLPKQKKNKLAQHIKYSNNLEDTARKLLLDIKAWGIKLPEQLGSPHISSGFGDMVCFILNDLLNRELIRVNFKFELPQFGDDLNNSNILNQQIQYDEQDLPEELMEDDQDEVENDELTQSILFYQKKFKTEQPDFNQIPQDRQIIQTKVAINEWMNEYNRVEKELNKFDTNLKEHKSYLKDYQKSMNLIKKCSKQLTILSQYLKSNEVQDIQQQWINYLELIPKLETQLTNLIQPEIQEILQTNRQSIFQFEIQINSLNKSNCSKLELDQQLHQNLTDIQFKIPNLSDNRPKQRQIINQLKNDINDMNVKIGILQTQLTKSYSYNNEQLSDEEEF
ncbi:unnamed protein product [Paramecium pentaurelia]|uniref:non-specific serine/threonine protein kinase n=1 Tax=Paramecium pentaurelia TaxID=43138 RepID=A0A8S1XNA5_9CILI|nr:unnamed protein product [Paramecium pentaurelia]